MPGWDLEALGEHEAVEADLDPVGTGHEPVEGEATGGRDTVASNAFAAQQDADRRRRRRQSADDTLQTRGTARARPCAPSRDTVTRGGGEGWVGRVHRFSQETHESCEPYIPYMDTSSAFHR